MPASPAPRCPDAMGTPPPHPDLARRHWLSQAGALVAATGLPWVPAPAWPHGSAGPLDNPRALGDWPLLDDLGQQRPLSARLRGQVTAIQLMFTGCSALCPLQGALFANVQQRLGADLSRLGIRLLSISIDPLADDPAALARWRRGFEAGQAWRTASPRPGDLDALLEQLDDARTAPRPLGDRHSTQVMVCDRQGRLRWRSLPLTGADPVVQTLRQLARSTTS